MYILYLPYCNLQPVCRAAQDRLYATVWYCTVSNRTGGSITGSLSSSIPEHTAPDALVLLQLLPTLHWPQFVSRSQIQHQSTDDERAIAQDQGDRELDHHALTPAASGAARTYRQSRGGSHDAFLRDGFWSRVSCFFPLRTRYSILEMDLAPLGMAVGP